MEKLSLRRFSPQCLCSFAQNLVSVQPSSGLKRAAVQLAALLGVLAFVPADASAQTVAPDYASAYTAASLGSVPGVPISYGGLTFKSGNPNVLLIGGSANNNQATIHAINVVRDANKHITGFSGTSTVFANAPGLTAGIDGGLTYGPGNVLFYTTYSDNCIGQIKPGNTAPDKIVNLNNLGVVSSVGSLLFVPPGQPGAGRLKLLSYISGRWYDSPFSADGTGTYNIGFANTDILINGGPEGAIYVPIGSPLFTKPAVLVDEYGFGIVAAYDVDAIGDPIPSTRREFINGLTGAEGAVTDPLTGDFLFSTYGGANQVVVVKGFAPPAPGLTINDITVVEGDTGTTNATFTLTLSNSSTKTITVNYATANGTASSGSDYTASSGTVTFTPGQTSRTVIVPIIGDVLDEANETFIVNLSTAVNATFTDKQGIGTITDNDATPGLSINDVTLTEGNTGTTNPAKATFTVTLSAVSGQTVKVNYATANSSAVAPGDFTATSGTLTFAPGETSKTVPVTIVGDLLDESNEEFLVSLTTPVNATLTDAQGKGTITDDDATPTLRISDVTVAEGDTGSVNAVFTVTLSAASGQPVSVSYATANGTATSASDYTASTGTIDFTPGQTSKTLTVAVLGDLLDEANETFLVNLSSPVNVTLADAQGLGTITDNDATPTLSINDVTLAEGNSGTTNAIFKVTLSAASGQTVKVNYATTNSSAVAPSDFASTSGTLTINAGALNGTITVPVIGDAIAELDEVFFVNLSVPVNATLADNQGKGTITNDDGVVPKVFISDVKILEGDQGTGSIYFTVRLSAPASGVTKVSYSTANSPTNPATAGTDYTAASGTITFNAGQITQPIAIAVIGDTAVENNELFLINLSNAVGAVISDSQAIGTIANDDQATAADQAPPTELAPPTEEEEEPAKPSVEQDPSANSVSLIMPFSRKDGKPTNVPTS